MRIRCHAGKTKGYGFVSFSAPEDCLLLLGCRRRLVQSLHMFLKRDQEKLSFLSFEPRKRGIETRTSNQRPKGNEHLRLRAYAGLSVKSGQLELILTEQGTLEKLSAAHP